MSEKLIPVLAIGLAGHHGMTNEQMQEGSRQMTREAATSGYHFESRFVSSEFPAHERDDLIQLLKARSWAVVVIGSGLRLVEANTRLLEVVVDCVLTSVSPVPKLAFPTVPSDMIPTFDRVLSSSAKS